MCNEKGKLASKDKERHHCLVDPSAPSILRARVLIPNDLLYFLALHCLIDIKLSLNYEEKLTNIGQPYILSDKAIRRIRTKEP